MLKLLLLPFKLIGLGVKIAGIRNSIFILIGVGIGLLIAPQTGAELRARLQSRLAASRSGGIPADEDLSL